MHEVTFTTERPEDILEHSLLVLKGLADTVSTLSFSADNDDSPELPSGVLFSLGWAMEDYADRADAAFQQIMRTRAAEIEAGGPRTIPVIRINDETPRKKKPSKRKAGRKT